MAKFQIPFDVKDIQAEARKRFNKLNRSLDGGVAGIDQKSRKKNEDKSRYAFRTETIWPEDGLGLERIIDDNNLFHVNYFEHAQRAVRAVCKIHVHDRRGVPYSSGTGFLVGEALLLTNNHVLPDAVWARGSHAEFEFEYDINYSAKRTMGFALRPEDVFLTNKRLDFTFVGVAGAGGDGARLEEYGVLPLIPTTGKAIVHEPVSIIQHPNGGLKRVGLRHSRIIGIAGDAPDDHFLHYTTDTEPGSSGAPVLNDQWQVVALHHAGVPGPGGTWIANEGIRVSRIISALGDATGDEGSAAALVLRRIGTAFSDGIGVTLPVTMDSGGASFTAPAAEARPYPVRRWKKTDGYKKNFLGHGVTVPIPLPASTKDLSPVDGGGFELKYTHYSVVMGKSRRLAYVAAVNIDGAQPFKLPRAVDKWRFDPRLDHDLQIDNDAYVHNDFDRGHLVRRLSPVWGRKTTATKANNDTFHYTNCAPQHKDLNRKTWLDLENYILKTARHEDARASVFTGPVFRPDDRLYRNQYLIPASYWKVAAMLDEDGSLVAAAYLQTQKDLIGDVNEAAFGDYKTYRVPVRLIAELTGLDFGLLLNADRRSSQESMTGVTPVTGPDDVDVF